MTLPTHPPTHQQTRIRPDSRSHNCRITTTLLFYSTRVSYNNNTYDSTIVTIEKKQSNRYKT
jgi:hypothetical protein